jgi:antitoxin component of MazEF toxin-antitoxin module
MMTVTIKKIGGSMGIVIPKSVASDMGLTEGAALDISVRNGVIVMPRPGRRARRPLKTLAGQHEPCGSRDTGFQPVRDAQRTNHSRRLGFDHRRHGLRVRVT